MIGAPAALLAATLSLDAAGTLARMVEDDWHPLLSDPVWLELGPTLEAELRSKPNGPIAVLARRTAVRVDIAVDPLVSPSSHLSNFLLDTRPWFELATALPYFVELWARLDDEPPITLATAFSGQQCGARTIDLASPRPIAVGFHRVSLSMDITYVRRLPARAEQRCAFLTRGMTAARLPGLAGATAIGREHRELPGMAFGLFDRGNDERFPGDDVDDVFIRAAKRTSIGALDPRLGSIALDRWLNSLAGPRGSSADQRRQIDWMTGFCDEDEALWYFAPVRDTPEYWRASNRARKRPRELCATALFETGDARNLVGVRVVVGALLEDEANWQLVTPRLYEAFIDGSGNTLEVPALGDLTARLRLPEDLWPRVDLSVTPLDVTLDPPRPEPGQMATVRVTVRNMGGRTVKRARMTMVVVPCCDERLAVFYQGIGDVPVEGIFTVERPVLLPTGGARVSFTALPWPTDGRQENHWRRVSGADWNEQDNGFVDVKIGRW